MSLSHSPSVVTNGLVFYYDTANTQKSWKGAPTTNVIVGPNWLGATLTYDYRGPSGDATYTYVTGVENPINSPGVMRYYTGPATAYRYWALRGTVPSAGTYTFSYYARVIVGGSSNIGNSQLWRNTGTDQGVTGDFNPTFTTEWKRYSTTGTVTSYLDYFPVHSGALLGGFTIEYCGFQLEAGSFATPFVDGARSSIQAIVDLTGNNTLTATSLTYASDGTFSFNGTTNLMQTPTTPVGQGPVTLMAWIKGTNGMVISSGTLYGLFSEGSMRYWYWSSVSGGWINYSTTTSVIPANVWTHIAVTHTPGSSALPAFYVNGILYPSTGTSPTPTNSGGASNVTFGEYSGYQPYSPYNGKIAVAKIYNRALSAAEVSQNFQALRGRYGI